MTDILLRIREENERKSMCTNFYHSHLILSIASFTDQKINIVIVAIFVLCKDNIIGYSKHLTFLILREMIDFHNL